MNQGPSRRIYSQSVGYSKWITQKLFCLPIIQMLPLSLQAEFRMDYILLTEKQILSRRYPTKVPHESSIPFQGISFYLNDKPPAKYGIGKDVIIVKVLCVTHFFIILPSFRVVAITPSNFSIVLTWLYRFRVEVIGLVMLLD